MWESLESFPRLAGGPSSIFVIFVHLVLKIDLHTVRLVDLSKVGSFATYSYIVHFCDPLIFSMNFRLQIFYFFCQNILRTSGWLLKKSYFNFKKGTFFRNFCSSYLCNHLIKIEFDNLSFMNKFIDRIFDPHSDLVLIVTSRHIIWKLFSIKNLKDYTITFSD